MIGRSCCCEEIPGAAVFDISFCCGALEALDNNTLPVRGECTQYWALGGMPVWASGLHAVSCGLRGSGTLCAVGMVAWGAHVVLWVEAVGCCR